MRYWIKIDMIQLIKKTLFVIGVSLLINGIVMLFISKFNSIFIFLFFVSIAIILYARFFHKIKKITHILIGIFYLIPFSIMVFLAVYGSISNVQYDEDAIIVLGAGIRGEKVTRILANRLNTAIEYHKKNPTAFIIVTGGQGRREFIAESLAMKRYLIASGIPEEKIYEENKSHNTFQNLSYSRDIILEHFPEGFTCVIISNSFHIYRASVFAGKLGITSRYIGVVTPWYNIPLSYFREVIAVIRIWIIPSRVFVI